MELKCLSSGSVGNCYVLKDSEGKMLLLDLGVSYKEVLKGVGFDIVNIVGACVTHKHSDHSLSAKDAKNHSVRIFKPYEQAPRRNFRESRFRVKAFDLTDLQGHFKHTNADGTECPCYGFYITHPEMGKMVYITDTELIKWRFQGLNTILIAANYDDAVLKNNCANYEHVKRGHLAISTTKEFCRMNGQNANNIILCHLSESNADREKFIREIKEVVPASCNVCCAYAGMTLNISTIPFM